MYHHATNYGAVWFERRQINPAVNVTVSQNTLPCVVRISCVVEPIFHRYHQTMLFFLRSDSLCCSSKLCKSDFSWGKKAKSNGARSSEYVACCVLPYLLIFHSSFSFRESLVSYVYLFFFFFNNCAVHVLFLLKYEHLNVCTGIIFADT